MFNIINILKEVNILSLDILFFLVELRYDYNYAHFVPRVVIVSKYPLPTMGKILNTPRIRQQVSFPHRLRLQP